MSVKRIPGAKGAQSRLQQAVKHTPAKNAQTGTSSPLAAKKDTRFDAFTVGTDSVQGANLGVTQVDSFKSFGPKGLKYYLKQFNPVMTSTHLVTNPVTGITMPHLGGDSGQLMSRTARDPTAKLAKSVKVMRSLGHVATGVSATLTYATHESVFKDERKYGEKAMAAVGDLAMSVAPPVVIVADTLTGGNLSGHLKGGATSIAVLASGDYDAMTAQSNALQSGKYGAMAKAFAHLGARATESVLGMDESILAGKGRYMSQKEWYGISNRKAKYDSPAAHARTAGRAAALRRKTMLDPKHRARVLDDRIQMFRKRVKNKYKVKDPRMVDTLAAKMATRGNNGTVILGSKKHVARVKNDRKRGLVKRVQNKYKVKDPRMIKTLAAKETNRGNNGQVIAGSKKHVDRVRKDRQRMWIQRTKNNFPGLKGKVLTIMAKASAHAAGDKSFD